MSKKDLTEKEAEKQEHLSPERLKKYFTVDSPLFSGDVYSGRPEANLIDLMHWVRDKFGSITLKGKGDLNCWIHNKIVMDGSFLQFAETHDVSIKCLHRDSIASWASDNKHEHFMGQGIFEISQGDLKFLHAALFHKGNQNEDEVSFFVVVSDGDNEAYRTLRNTYDKWMTDRDRDHLEVNVIGGDNIPYERDMEWDELFLPETLKNDIRQSIEGFLAAKDLYAKRKIPWKRGILLYGDPGNGKTTAIRTIISNYDFKPVTVPTSGSTDDNVISQAFSYAQEQSPALLYLEDLDTLLGRNVSLSHFLNLVDGIATSNGLLIIATANDLSELKQSVIDRPSRFDRKWEIPLPNEEMSLIYLKKWFEDGLNDDNYEKIVVQTVEHNFSYAYLKELYLTSAYHAVADGREAPILEDVESAMEQLVSDKNNVEGGFASSNQGQLGF